MALNSSSTFLVFFSLLVTSLVLNVSAADGSQKAVLVDGWIPIKDPKDPRVQEIGKFAVNEHNIEAKTNLVYKSVIKAETTLDVSGSRYRLTISASDDLNFYSKYEAVVLDKPLERLRNLISFKKIHV